MCPQCSDSSVVHTMQFKKIRRGDDIYQMAHISKSRLGVLDQLYFEGPALISPHYHVKIDLTLTIVSGTGYFTDGNDWEPFTVEDTPVVLRIPAKRVHGLLIIEGEEPFTAIARHSEDVGVTGDYVSVDIPLPLGEMGVPVPTHSAQ